MGGHGHSCRQDVHMSYTDRLRDVTRMSRAILRERKEGPGAALACLADGPRSSRYRALWETFVARLRILSREGTPSTELPPLHHRQWFTSPSNPVETYCKTYVLYMEAVLKGDERVAEQHRSTLRDLKVIRFVRGVLLVT